MAKDSLWLDLMVSLRKSMALLVNEWPIGDRNSQDFAAAERNFYSAVETIKYGEQLYPSAYPLEKRFVRTLLPSQIGEVRLFDFFVGRLRAEPGARLISFHAVRVDADGGLGDEMSPIGFTREEWALYCEAVPEDLNNTLWELGHYTNQSRFNEGDLVKVAYLGKSYV